VIGGQDGVVSQQGNSVHVVLEEPEHSSLSLATTVGVNGYYDVQVPQVPAGSSSVSFTIAGQRAKRLTLAGYTAPRPLVLSVQPSLDPEGGRTVTILGRNFNGSISVKFGTDLATRVQRTSANKLMVEAPKRPRSTVLVTVITGAGGPSPLTGRSRYTYVPPPIVTKISPDKGTRSGGTLVNITGNNLFAPVEVHFGTESAGIKEIISSTELEVISPRGSGTVYVTVTTASGTSPGTRADRFNY